MFSSHTLITGGIITQTHGNIVQVYSAPEGASLTLGRTVQFLKQGTGSLGALQRATDTATPSNASTHLKHSSGRPRKDYEIGTIGRK